MDSGADMDDFRQAALRWFQDGECLWREGRYGGASHAYALAAECALKHAMASIPGGERKLPHKHLPELVDDAKRRMSGRTQGGLYQLLNTRDYMHGWRIENRYWCDSQFTSAMVENHRKHARRTCSAAQLGV